MLPVIAIVGRPNVGKSTLFNRLTKTRDALVADVPGLTRDRQYGRASVGNRGFILIDTGGIGEQEREVDDLMATQTGVAIEEADAILFMVDARAGVTAADQNLVQQLRTLKKPIFLVANKIDGVDESIALADFFQFGLGEPHAIAAEHGRGVAQLINTMLADCSAEIPEDDEAQGIKIAVVGRPNVGKSTLVNRILGEERVVVFDEPGTTRDSIYVPFERRGIQYTLIDTAGVRRRRGIKESIEKFSVVKAFQAIEDAHVVVMVLNAQEEIAGQDLRLLGYILNAGRALVLAINKWDDLDIEQRETIKKQLDRKLTFLDFANSHFISALHGSGVGDIFDSVNKAYEAAMRDLVTSELTNLLEKAVGQHQPPLAKGRRIKLRYAHAGGKNPPIIVVHGRQTKALPDAYKRYLIKFFRKKLKLQGTPIRLELSDGENPYDKK